MEHHSFQTCFQTCSLPPGADIWWLLKHLRLVQIGGKHPTRMLSCTVHDVAEPRNTQLQVRDLLFLRQHRSSTKLETKYLENQWSMLLFVYLLFCFTLDVFE